MQNVPRLIKQFIPTNYNLSIAINRLNRTFDGIVTITGKQPHHTEQLLLHCKELKIESIEINRKKAEYSYGDNDSLIITKPEVNNKEIIVVIVFKGSITDSMHGMYPCYFEHNGIKKELIATQFESHHAREVFPCIDEPEAKAIFDVTLTTETNVIVLGNMPIQKQTVDDNYLISTFKSTPIMSSYLLAWVIGELHKKTAYTKSGVEVNVWATPAQPTSCLDFALDIATRSIDFYDDYFGTPYPLSKCDNVALPDFESGAMENWGLITYREIAVLVDPKITSIASKHYIASVITHELSHQWFGNLVTMKWWNDLWLNESFASLVEYTALDAIEPDWNVWLDFASCEVITALRRDSIAGVQSVQTEVNHPDEISTLFDGAIVYAKGARLLKMLQNYIGNDAFRTAIKEYFRIYAYKNTTANDLWSIFSDISHKDIVKFMNTWICQPGFPVLHVIRNTNKILISQERLTNQSNKTSEFIWPIPLNSNYTKIPEILDSQSLEITISDTKPLRFNIGDNAHFITHYSHILLNELIVLIKSDKLSPLDRLQLLNEQIILAGAGIISNAELIPLVDAYKKESAEAVWDIISMVIGRLKKFVESDNQAEKKLRAFAGSLAQIQFDRLGWASKPNESETDTKLRSTIIGFMIYSENPKIIDYAVNEFNTIPIDKINPELREIIISTTVRYRPNDNIIKSLIENYKTTTSSEIQHDISSGLTASNDPAVIAQLLDLITDTSIIRVQDCSRWIILLMRNKHARNQTWQWERDNWDWINANFAGDKSYDDYPRYTAAILSTKKQLDEYRNFFNPLRNDPSLKRVIDMGISEISDRVNLIERDSKSVKTALQNL